MVLGDTFVHEADVLVLGGGIAGCFAAIKAKEAGSAEVIQLDKGRVGKTGCSAFAAGIYPAFLPGEDDYDKVFNDVLVDPAPFLVDQERLKTHLETVWDTVKDMESYGVEFERTPEGKLERVVTRCKTPSLMFHGEQFMEAIARAGRRRGVKQFNKTMMTNLLTRNGQVVGAVAFDTVTGDFHIFKAKATILATGSTAYKGLCPGHRNCTGDGLVAAYEAGADMTAMEFPLRNLFPARFDIGPGMGLYIGMGGKFVNRKGERFMEIYEPVLKDMGLLNTLDFYFAIEVKRGNAPIYMDMTHFSAEQVRKLKKVITLPMMMYEKSGIVKGDKFVEKIEWMAYPPRSISGCLTTTNFETCLAGLYAIGDTIPWGGAEGGAAGLPGAATSGTIAARAATKFAKENGKLEVDEKQVTSFRERVFKPLNRKEGIEPDHVLIAVQENIIPYDILMLRKEDRLSKALANILEIRQDLVPRLLAYDPHYLRMALEAENLVTCAEMQLTSALFRKESRGGFGFREDYPYQDNVNWLKWVSLKKSNEEMKVFTQNLPIEKYPVKPARTRELDPLWKRIKDLGVVSIKEEQIKWE